MEATVQIQAMALLQGLGLGLLAGGVYDLFRILRVRVRIPLLSHILDLAYWMMVTWSIFLWSTVAWGGWIRFYGIGVIFLGGVLYFLIISHITLLIGYEIANIIEFLCRIIAWPLATFFGISKKIKEILKNLFLFQMKWFKIEEITVEMDSTTQRRRNRKGKGT